MTPCEGAPAAGERWDWAELRALCLREARHVLGPSAAAEDAAQEATLRAWRNRGACRTPEAPAPWIAAIARREALRALPDRREILTEPNEERPTAGTEDAVLDRLAVAGAVRRLGADDRRLIVARYWDDLSYGELADGLGMPVSTVGVRLHRVRLRLRETLVSE